MQLTTGLVYDDFNAYARCTGKVLGVFLFAAFSVWLLSLALWHNAAMPRRLPTMGMATAAGLSVLALELFGLGLSVHIAPFSVPYMAWMVCLSVVLIRRARR